MFSLSTKFSPEATNFEKAVFAGYSSAELYTTPTRLMSWRSLSKIARSFELNYALHFPTVGKILHQTAEDMACLARDLNCNIVVVHKEHLDVAREIKFMAPEIQLAVENHFIHFNDLGNWLRTCSAATLDIEHLWKFTLHDCELSALLPVVKQLLHEHGDKIKHIHLPGYLPGQAEHKPMYCSRDMVLGVFDILYAEDYEGMVVSELNVPFQNEFELKMDRLLFESWQAKQPVPACFTDTADNAFFSSESQLY